MRSGEFGTLLLGPFPFHGVAAKEQSVRAQGLAAHSTEWTLSTFSLVALPSAFSKIMGIIVPLVLGFKTQSYQGKCFLGFYVLLCHEYFLRQKKYHDSLLKEGREGGNAECKA